MLKDLDDSLLEENELLFVSDLKELFTLLIKIGHFTWYTLLVACWVSFFAFISTLVLHGIDSKRFQRHYCEIQVHVDMIESHICLRFVVHSSMLPVSYSTTAQRCCLTDI